MCWTFLSVSELLSRSSSCLCGSNILITSLVSGRPTSCGGTHCVLLSRVVADCISRLKSETGNGLNEEAATRSIDRARIAVAVYMK